MLQDLPLEYLKPKTKKNFQDCDKEFFKSVSAIQDSLKKELERESAVRSETETKL